MAIIFESFVHDIGALTALLIAVIYIYFRHSFTYWKKRNVPYLEPSFPFGNFAEVVLATKSIGLAFQDVYKKLEGKKFGGTYMFTKPGFFFRDPELIKNVLVKDFSSFHDRGMYINEEVEPLTGHLFFLPGIKWRNLRVKLTPTFTSGKMKMMFPTLVDCGIELSAAIKGHADRGEILEMKDYLARYSTDVISSCAFGIESNSLKNPNAEFRQWGRKFFEPTFRTSMNFLLSSLAPAVLDFFKASVIDADVSKYFQKMVRDTITYRETNNVKRNDFMHLLLQLKNKGYVDPDEETIQDNDNNATEATSSIQTLSMGSLAAQAFVFFLAGFETSSTTMSFCMYELSVNTDIQERVREEINTVLGKYGGKITYEGILEMKYLDKVVSETLRKYPPVPILNREVTTKEYKVPGTDIILEQGTPAIIPILGIHHDSKYYPDPERFDPERFSDEEKTKRHPYVYLPFGEGPRICIGLRFGLMQTKVGLVSILSNYQFTVSRKTPVPLVIDKKTFVLTPFEGVWLKIQKCP